MESLYKLLEAYEKNDEELIMAMKLFHSQCGYLKTEHIDALVEYFSVTEDKVEGIAAFSGINLTAPELITIEICTGARCYPFNSALIDEMPSIIKNLYDETGIKATVALGGCYKMCKHGSIVFINGTRYTDLSKLSLKEALLEIADSLQERPNKLQ